MRRDSRLVVAARPRERRVPHALCVKHPTARTIFRPAFAALWQKVALIPCTHVLAEGRMLELERCSPCLIGLEHSEPIHHTHFAQNSVNVTLNSFFRET